jgi:hypothetical protein
LIVSGSENEGIQRDRADGLSRRLVIPAEGVIALFPPLRQRRTSVGTLPFIFGTFVT